MSVDEVKYWRIVARIVRCAQRYSALYSTEESEPAAARAAVADAVALSELRVQAGGRIDEHDECLWVGEAQYDGYDVEALKTALAAFDNAAENTHADLSEDPQIEPDVRRNWAAIRLAGLALHAAFQSDSSTFIDEVLNDALSITSDPR